MTGIYTYAAFNYEGLDFATVCASARARGLLCSPSVAPGFTGQRLPLPAEIMPTGLTWRPDGNLVFCSLKGQVFEAGATDPPLAQGGHQVVGDDVGAAGDVDQPGM